MTEKKKPTKKPPHPAVDPEEEGVNSAQDAFSKFIDRTDPPKKPPKEKDANAVALGRKGGLKGGKARAASLSPERRAEIAKKAAEVRWKRK